MQTKQFYVIGAIIGKNAGPKLLKIQPEEFDIQN